MALFLLLFPLQTFRWGFNETMAMASFWEWYYIWFMFSLSMTFYLFYKAFRSWGSIERRPTHVTCLLQIPVNYHSGIYSTFLPLEEGYRLQAFSRYPCLVQQTDDNRMRLPLSETRRWWRLRQYRVRSRWCRVTANGVKKNWIDESGQWCKKWLIYLPDTPLCSLNWLLAEVLLCSINKSQDG